MILVDTSALVAILLGEPEADELSAAIDKNDTSISASALVEANIVALGRGLVHNLQRLIESSEANIVALDEDMAIIAADAFRHYGKGRHKAGLISAIAWFMRRLSISACHSSTRATTFSTQT